MGFFCTGYMVPEQIPSVLAAKGSAGPGESDAAWESICIVWGKCFGSQNVLLKVLGSGSGGGVQNPLLLCQPGWAGGVCLWVGKTLASCRRAAEGTHIHITEVKTPCFDLPTLDPPLFAQQHPPRALIPFTHQLQRPRWAEGVIRSHHFDPSIFQLLPQPREYALPITGQEAFEVPSHPPASSFASPASSQASRRFSSSIGTSTAKM